MWQINYFEIALWAHTRRKYGWPGAREEMNAWMETIITASASHSLFINAKWIKAGLKGFRFYG